MSLLLPTVHRTIKHGTALLRDFPHIQGSSVHASSQVFVGSVSRLNLGERNESHRIRDRNKNPINRKDEVEAEPKKKLSPKLFFLVPEKSKKSENFFRCEFQLLRKK